MGWGLSSTGDIFPPAKDKNILCYSEGLLLKYKSYRKNIEAPRQPPAHRHVVPDIRYRVLGIEYRILRLRLRMTGKDNLNLNLDLNLSLALFSLPFNCLNISFSLYYPDLHFSGNLAEHIADNIAPCVVVNILTLFSITYQFTIPQYL